MDISRAAPLILRLGRLSLKSSLGSERTFQAQLRKPIIQHAFLSSTPRRSVTPPPVPPPERNTQEDPAVAAKASLSEPNVSSEASDSPPPQARRSLRTYVWMSAFIMVGIVANSVVRAIIFPPPLPEPESEEDAYLMSRIRGDLNELAIVRELRKDRDAWREYDPYSQREVFSTGGSSPHEQEEVERHMTAGSLRGSRGLAVQRSFYNATERREISVIFFGGGVSGWPGVTHGGAIATVLREAVERAVNGPAFASRDVDATAGADDQPSAAAAAIFGSRKQRYDCDTLTLTYKKPTQANNFYVIRAEVLEGPEQGGVVKVKAALEDALMGIQRVSVDASCSRTGAGHQGTIANATGGSGFWGSLGSLVGLSGFS